MSRFGLQQPTYRLDVLQLRPCERSPELKVDDYYHNGARRRLRLHKKGGKEHEMPVHHLLEQILNEYTEVAGLRSGQPCSKALILLERL